MDLREGRFRKGLSQWDLRVSTGINQTKISLIERGYVSPTDEEKSKLAKAIGVREKDLEFIHRNSNNMNSEKLCGPYVRH